MKTTVPLKFLIKNCNGKIFRYSNINNFLNKNRLLCRDCQYDNNCPCLLWKDINSKIGDNIASLILKKIWNNIFNKLKILDIINYNNGIIVMKFYNLIPTKLKNITNIMKIFVGDNDNSIKKSELEYFGSDIDSHILTIYYKKNNN
jgi:hypothetical protein